jgi:hypothetical protein
MNLGGLDTIFSEKEHCRMKAIQLLTVAALTLCIITPSSADTIKTNKTLAEKVLEKYQSFETYHAQWTPEINDSNNTSKMIWEVAFDRKTKSVLFLSATSQGDDETTRRKLGFLLVVDGINMNAAVDYGNGIEKKSKAIPDPNQLTYRDVRRAIPFIYPFDLPLIFSEYPFMEIIQGSVKETKTLTEESEFYPGIAIFPELEGETFAEYKIDPDTLLIQAFRFIYHQSSPSPTFKCNFVQINKKLPKDLFDFEKQLEQFANKPTKEK